MSVVKKTPAIETILGRLDSTELGILKAALNSSSFEIYKSLIKDEPSSVVLGDIPTDPGYQIGAYRLELDTHKIRNGFLIRVKKSNVTYEHFLVYGDSQKITIYELDVVNKSHKLIEEYCDINELRRIVDKDAPSFTDIYADNIFANDELELTDDGEIGSNLKAAIKALGLAYVTTAPTSDNTDGLKIAYLTSEPATKYDGWIYLIKE